MPGPLSSTVMQTTSANESKQLDTEPARGGLVLRIVALDDQVEQH